MDSTTSQCLDRRAWEELPSLPPYCPVPMPKDREAAAAGRRFPQPRSARRFPQGAGGARFPVLSLNLPTP